MMHVLATAYCLSGSTITGKKTEYGIIAVDPRIIPLHSRVIIHGHTFRAEDTGAYIHGRHIDIYMQNCDEALHYRKHIRIQVRG